MITKIYKNGEKKTRLNLIISELSPQDFLTFWLIIIPGELNSAMLQSTSLEIRFLVTRRCLKLFKLVTNQKLHLALGSNSYICRHHKIRKAMEKGNITFVETIK